jgi:hypothetical protein
MAERPGVVHQAATPIQGVPADRGLARIERMDPDVPSSSPFALPFGSPFRPEPEQPRLGIIHLLGWTACVAVCFSVTRASYPQDAAKERLVFLAFQLCRDVGRGTALAGLVLCVARRLRGLRFPSQPGETLLVLFGIAQGMWLVAVLVAVLLTLAMPNEMKDPSVRLLMLFQTSKSLGILLLGVLYLIATIRTRIPRWRLVFLALIVQFPLAIIISCAGIPLDLPAGGLIFAQNAPLLLVAAVMITVVGKDLLERVVYRWTHWVGVATAFWYGMVNVTEHVCWVLLGP